jgi:hypothetical protein
MKFRFSIRDLLWLTLVVGILLAWWLHERKSYTRMKIEAFRATTNELLVLDREQDLRFVWTRSNSRLMRPGEQKEWDLKGTVSHADDSAK